MKERRYRMETDAVQDSGLAPQSGDGADTPQDTPGEQGEEMVPVQKLHSLFKELKKWKDKYRGLKNRRVELEEREKTLEEMKEHLADAHLARLLTDAAATQDAINPQQVAAFLRERVTLGEDLKPVVVIPEGAREDTAGPDSVEELVAEFLSRYPYHRRAKLSGGSGSTPSPSAVTDTLKEQIRSAASHEELERIVSQKKS
jgi:hypothetical protein